MDIQPVSLTITALLSSKCKFVIPRFQRDYSWETKHYQEFIDDILSCLKIENGEIKYSQYFLGTMLFLGKLDRPDQEIKVVDGQQRLTTITILFSALSDHFKEIENDKLSERIFDFIMTEDANGNKVKILKSDTCYPFFQFYIQDRSKTNKIEATSEEEECIKDAFEYLHKRTSENEVKKSLKKIMDKANIFSLKYEDILKAVRDQVLFSSVVVICSNDKNDANKIFEILNAKGKRLASVDLIKNKIFEVMSQTEPADVADVKWSSVKKHLYSGDNTVGLSTFFRHYWVSKYSNTSERNLYNNFAKEKNIIK